MCLISEDLFNRCVLACPWTRVIMGVVLYVDAIPGKKWNGHMVK